MANTKRPLPAPKKVSIAPTPFKLRAGIRAGMTKVITGGQHVRPQDDPQP
jgi:hypothetical protein